MVRVLVRPSPVPGFVAAAVVTSVPPVGLVVARVLWRDPVLRVPVHWGGGGADGFGPSSALFWTALVPSVVTAVLAAGMALLLDGSSGRRSTAAAFAVLGLFGAALALQWPVAQLTAADRALEDGVGVPFLLYLVALPLAVLAGGAAMLRRRAPSAGGSRSSSRCSPPRSRRR